MSESKRFHLLSTPRGTVVQPGPVHGDMTEDPAATFDHLDASLVGGPGAA